MYLIYVSSFCLFFYRCVTKNDSSALRRYQRVSTSSRRCYITITKKQITFLDDLTWNNCFRVTREIVSPTTMPVVGKLSVSVARKLTPSLVGGWSRDAHLPVCDCETTRPYLTPTSGTNGIGRMWRSGYTGRLCQLAIVPSRVVVVGRGWIGGNPGRNSGDDHVQKI